MVFLCIVLSSHEACKIDAEFEWNMVFGVHTKNCLAGLTFV